MQNVTMQLCKSCNLGFDLNHWNMFALRLKALTCVFSFILIMMTILFRKFVEDDGLYFSLYKWIEKAMLFLMFESFTINIIY
jgi:hypothetical protein